MSGDRLNLADLDAFRAVANTLSFRAAAQRLGISQSAVTQAVARLETKLETRLFHRTTRAVSLTPAGDALITYAAAMAKIADETRVHFASGGRQQLRVGIVEDFAIAGLHRLLVLLMAEEPNLGILFRTGLSTSLRRALDDGDLDMALIKRPAGSGEGHLLGTKGLVWVGQPRTFGRDDVVPLVTYPSPSETRDAAVTALRDAGRRWGVVGESEGMTGLSAAIIAGLGVGAFSERLMPPDLAVLQRDGLPPLGELDYVLLTSSHDVRVTAAASVVAELAREMLAP